MSENQQYIIQQRNNNGKPVAIVQQNENTICLCNRKFTIDDIKLVVTELRAVEHISNVEIWKPALNTGAAPNEKDYETMVNELNRVMEKYEINSCLRKIHFLAQCYHETDRFRSTQEYGAKLKYDPYRGRGLIHLTHLDNYNRFAKHMDDSKITSTPSIVAINSTYAYESGAWFWKSQSSWGDLNLYADLDDLYYINIGVNGGFNGFDLRIKYIQQLIKILDVKSCKNINLTKELGIYLYSTSKIRSTRYGARNQKIFERYDKFSEIK